MRCPMCGHEMDESINCWTCGNCGQVKFKSKEAK